MIARAHVWGWGRGWEGRIKTGVVPFIKKKNLKSGSDVTHPQQTSREIKALVSQKAPL